MGLSSSQARLLNLTTRMHQIEYKAAKIEAEKLQMANKSKRVYQEYQNALERTKIQYKSITSDGSATFLDATLAILENGIIPGYNQGVTSAKSFLLQNARTGDIYITEALASQYPYMREPIEDPGTLDEYLHLKNIYPEPVYETVTDYDNVIKINSYPENVPNGHDTTIPSTNDIFKNVKLACDIFGITYDDENLRESLENCTLGILAYINSAVTSSFSAYNDGNMQTAEYVLGHTIDLINNNFDITQESWFWDGRNNNDGITQRTEDDSEHPLIVEYGTKKVQTGSEYNKDENYYKYCNEWQIKRAACDAGYKFVVVADELANNKDFLNNHLTVNEAILIDWDIFIENKENPETSVATNTFFQEVDDEKELRKAEAKYEADMRQIDMKDRKFDYDLAALDAERNAVKQEMETLKTVAKDNVDRTFKLFG